MTTSVGGGGGGAEDISKEMLSALNILVICLGSSNCNGRGKYNASICKLVEPPPLLWRWFMMRSVYDAKYLYSRQTTFPFPAAFFFHSNWNKLIKAIFQLESFERINNKGFLLQRARRRSTTSSKRTSTWRPRGNRARSRASTRAPPRTWRAWSATPYIWSARWKISAIER